MLPWFRRIAVAVTLGAVPMGAVPMAGAAMAGAAWAQGVPPAPTPAPSDQVNKRIVVVPPLQWDSNLGSFHSLYHQTPTDFARLTGGILFGMQPNEVNALLPEPVVGVAWNTLPTANEFPEDVRYFWIKLANIRGPESAGLAGGVTACAGEASHLLFLFRARGLFRMSYRLSPDASCPSVAEAATEILAYYATAASNVAISMHYRNGTSEVVDIVDPAAGYLIPMRWESRRR